MIILKSSSSSTTLLWRSGPYATLLVLWWDRWNLCSWTRSTRTLPPWLGSSTTQPLLLWAPYASAEYSSPFRLIPSLSTFVTRRWLRCWSPASIWFRTTTYAPNCHAHSVEGRLCGQDPDFRDLRGLYEQHSRQWEHLQLLWGHPLPSCTLLLSTVHDLGGPHSQEQDDQEADCFLQQTRQGVPRPQHRCILFEYRCMA